MRLRNGLLGLGVGLLLVAVWALGSAAAASAATDVVTNLHDSGPGSLRTVIAAAGSGDTVEFESGVTGTISLTSGAIAIEKSLTIVGPGASLLKINAGHKSRVFETTGTFSSISVSISGLTLAEGSGELGGAIYFEPDVTSGPASLTVTASTFSDNAAGGEGTKNSASGQGSGGGIAFETTGMLTVMNSTFTGNTAGGNGGGGTSSGQGNGGAIETFGEDAVSVTDSSFSANKAGGNGGDGESSAQGSGGAIDFFGTAEHATLTVTASTFNGNQAGGSAGAGESSGEGVGGAIELFGEGAAMLTNDTIEGNSVGGPIGAASGAGVAGGGLYGGLPATLLNDTLDANAVIGAAGVGGNIDASWARSRSRTQSLRAARPRTARTAPRTSSPRATTSRAQPPVSAA